MAKAVILAAGKSSKFFPPLYDKPKGLFTFKGEVLIERQIRQLQEAGIDDIVVVVGYEKERFFYLEEAFGVRLVVNTDYNDACNLSSLNLVRRELEGAYVCCADHWYASNPFEGKGHDSAARLVQFFPVAKKEFVIRQNDDGYLVDMQSGAESGMCMVGYAYFTPSFAKTFFALYDAEKDYVGMNGLFWEQFWGRHERELPLRGIETLPEEVKEFDSLGDFASLDEGVLDNVSQVAIGNICRLIKCERADIKDIRPLNKGLTNVSFSFYVDGERYVYRHPGASSSNMVVRTAEVIAQMAAVEIGIDSSVLAIDEAGWKLSRYIDAVSDLSYDDADHLVRAVEQIRQFHATGVRCDYEVNLLEEGDRLQKLASAKKGDLAGRFADLHEQLIRLWHYVELDGVPKVLCHNDTYAVNWIVGEDALCMIDWEYAGMNDPFNDIATMTVRDGLSIEKNEELLQLFLGHDPTFEERRHDYAINALCGWYWFNWSLFKDTLGEDGFFMLPSWRALNTYLPLALAMYEGELG